MWKTVYAEKIFIVRFKNSYVFVAPLTQQIYTSSTPYLRQYFSYIVTSVLFVEKTRVPEVTDKLNKMNCELKLTYDTPAYMLNVYKSQLSRQTGSRNLTGQKTLPTKWGIEHICSFFLSHFSQQILMVEI
jgi:hypothetical protein